MRFSTLTVVVFAAHTSTLAIVPLLPFHDDVQELVARRENHPPTAASGALGSRLMETATKVARMVPPVLTHSPVLNTAVSVV
jgi:hypothetical protein